MEISQLKQKIFENRSNKYQKFKLAFQIIKLASREAFEEAYGSTSNFLFDVDSQGKLFTPMVDGAETYNATSFNETVNKLNGSKTINYKFCVDNGKVPDLTYRSTRGDLIKKIISKLKGYRDLLRLLNIKYDEIEFTSKQGGGNPTLKFSINYAKKIPDKKSGMPKIVKMSLKFQISLKVKKENQAVGKNPLKKLKPSHIKPSIVGVKLTPEIFKARLHLFIEKNLQASQYVKKLFSETVDLSDNENLVVKSNMSSELSSELFEVLSALKLAKMIKGKNKSFLKGVLSFDDEMIKSIDPLKVKIKMPRKSNESLMDYEIYYNDNNSIKVSVKSKLSSNPATVKFGTVFADEREVGTWFKGVANKTESIRGSAMIAGNSLTYKRRFSGKETLYPIKALHDLLASSTFSDSAWSDMVRNANLNIDPSDGINKNIIKSILLKTHKSMGIVNFRYTPLDSLIKYTSGELAALKMFIAKNIKYRNKSVTEAYIEIANKNIAPEEVVEKVKGKAKTSYVIMNSKDYPNLKGDDRYPFTLNNFAYLCEKVVVASSKENSNSKINFWQLFYDNVLSKKQILYSILYEKKVAGNLTLEYKFVSTINFAKYSKWVELRSKNSAFNMQDTLGMNP